MGLGTHFEKKPFKNESTLRLPRCPHRTDIKNPSDRKFINGLKKMPCEAKWSESKNKSSNTECMGLGTLEKAKKQYFGKTVIEKKPI